MRSNDRPCLCTVIPLLVLMVGAMQALAAVPGQGDCTGPDPDRTIAACTAMLQQSGQLSPRVKVAALHHRGVAYVRNRDYDRAIADYDAALQIAPNYAPTYNFRGIAYRLKGDQDRAIADHDAAIRRDPRNAQFFNNRGVAYRWKSDYDRAIADYSQAIQLNPNYALAYANRAFAYRMKLDFTHALADHDAAVRFAPQTAPPYMHRGATYEAMENYEKALADYRQGFARGAVGDRAVQAIRRVEQRLAARATAAPPAPATTSAIPRSQARPTPAPAISAPATPAPAPPSISGLVAVTARPEVRVALIIGNSKYANAPSLANPQNDAQTLAGALQRVGFTQVTLKLDLARDKLVDELKTFAAAADRADWAVVYFAGHGLEVGGANYLVPIDAKLAADRDVTFETVPLDQVLQSVEGARKLHVVILDACRDNPFVKTMTRSLSATRSVGIGLANLEPEGATLVAFAAKHGQTAMDGTGGNSPFVSALVKNLDTPNLEINLLFRKVRDDVLTTTGRRQEPFTYGSLPSESFYFRKP